MKRLINLLILQILTFVSFSQTRTTSGDAIRKEITPKYVNGVIKQLTIAQLKAQPISNGDSTTLYYVTDAGKRGYFELDKNDNSSVGNDSTIIVTNNGKRLKRTIEQYLSPSTTGKYYRGDKTWQDLNKSSVGLSNVDNTSDLNKPISTAAQTALLGKIDKGYSISELRGLPNSILAATQMFYCSEAGKEGFWRYDASDNSSVDNLGTILVTSGGKRLKRIIENNVLYPEWFGAVGDGLSNDYTYIQNCINYGYSVYFSKTYNIGGGNIALANISSIRLYGSGMLKNGQISLSGCSKIEILKLKFENLYISLGSSNSKITINGNSLTNITNGSNLGAINITSSCSDIFITGNTIDNVSSSNLNVNGCGIKIESFSSAFLDNIDISSNYIKNIYGPAAIWVGGIDNVIKNIKISNNEISKTQGFGIEFYRNSGSLLFENGIVLDNQISDIGSIRSSSTGVGCGGIYCNINANNLRIVGNYIKNVLEVGIEGYYEEVSFNYIEDTGSDFLNRPIVDNAGIYNGGKNVKNNTIINPGNSGGYYFYNSGLISDKNLESNTIINNYQYWSANTNYTIGDIVTSSNKVYVCKVSGVSGNTSISGATADISDGSVTWDYKKDLCLSAISINATSGISNINIINNTSINIKNFSYLSAFLSDINILNNSMTYTNSNYENGNLVTGYGSRICKRLSLSNVNNQEMKLPNSDFGQFSGSVPNYWSLSNGSISKIVNSEGKTVPRIIQSDGTFGTKISQIFRCGTNNILFFKCRFKSNDGLRIKVYNGYNNSFLSEQFVTENSGQYIEYSGIIPQSGLNKIKIEISCKTNTDNSSNFYIELDYFKVFGIESDLFYTSDPDNVSLINKNETITSVKKIQPTVTNSSLLGKGFQIEPILNAEANNSKSIALDIYPTFNNYSFTGVENYAIRHIGNILPNGDNLYAIGNQSNNYSSIRTRVLQSDNTLSIGTNNAQDVSFKANSTFYAKLFSTGNFSLQNGGTYSDTGERLQVNGVALITDKLKLQTGTNKSVGTLVLTSGLGTITSTAITTNSIIWITTKTLSGTSAHDYTYNISADGTATITARQNNGSTETGCNSTIQYWIIN